MEQGIDSYFRTIGKVTRMQLRPTWRFMLAVFGLSFLFIQGRAQSADALIRKGNQQYMRKQFGAAETSYMKASAFKKKAPISLFNLGNSLYRQNRFGEARANYEKSLKASTDSLDKSRAYYNIGNAFLKQKNWQNSIQEFEKSLIRNPSDNQARYNLAYAQAMLKKQQGGGGGQKNNKDKQNNKNKQNNNKQNNKNNQNKNQQQPNQKQQNQQQKNQQPQNQSSNISKQEAQNILNALDQQEQKILEKKNQKHGTPVTNGKDW